MDPKDRKSLELFAKAENDRKAADEGSGGAGFCWTMLCLSQLINTGIGGSIDSSSS